MHVRVLSGWIAFVPTHIKHIYIHTYIHDADDCMCMSRRLLYISCDDHWKGQVQVEPTRYREVYIEKKYICMHLYICEKLLVCATEWLGVYVRGNERDKI